MHLKSRILPLITLSLFGLPNIGFSGENPMGFNGNGEAGFSDSTGNTISTSFYSALKLNYNQKHNELKSIFELNYKSENSVQTQERYLIDLQNNRYYNAEHSYFSYIGGQLEKSRFEGIELNSTLSLGLGKSIIKNSDTNLIGEVGIGQNSTRYTQGSGGNTNNQTIARAKLNFNHQINAQVTFLQDLTYLTGNDQSKIESNTGFKIKVADQMNLKASYKYRHNDNPATGVEKTDTQTALTLIYDF
ncbi:MAG: putative salt-induced outer membrane protein [Thiomicrorhabdus sp.]|nr:MAG: putative salt-induced outer membrane protein [Thiomicrorhabdus sp.]